MAQQTIGLGAAPNDGTGDDLRVAGDKINDNFAELYVARHPGYVAGRWYIPFIVGGANGTAPGANSIRLVPIHIFQSVAISDLGCRITTLSAGGNVQLAIYASDPATHLPTGSPVASTASISTASAAAVSADITGANPTLAAGWYWAAMIVDNATAAFQTFGQSVFGDAIGSTTLANIAGTTLATLLTFAHTFGTWPNLTGQTFVEANGLTSGIVFIKAA